MGSGDTAAARHPLVRGVAASLRRLGVREGAAVLIAVSGGADSVALCRAAATIAPRRRWGLSLTVGHVQHHLRDDAEADAAFVADLARAHGVRHLRRDVEPAAAGGNTEHAARRLRYAALRAMAVEAGAAFVLTAHHADDQLETVLMRLIRGASVGGLRGIAPRRALGGGVTLLRPMLGATGGDARAFLRDLGQPWREDHTNADGARWRARLRRDVVPVLRELRPDAAAKAVALGRRLAAASRLIAEQTAAAHEAHVRKGQLQRTDARAMSPALLAGVVRRMLRDAGVRPDALGGRAVSPLLRAVRDGRGGRREWRFGGGVRVWLDRDTLRVAGHASNHPA